jgi:hypothetical protein
MDKRIVASSDQPTQVAAEAATHLGGKIDRVIAAFPATVAGVYNDGRFGDIIVTAQGWTSESVVRSGDTRLHPLPR